MIYYIKHIKDIIGNNYLGIDIPKHVVEPHLNELKDIIGDDYDEFVDFKNKRDNGNYHITVINVMDYNKLSKEIGIDKFVNSLDNIFKYPIDDLKLLGIGRAQRNENVSFYVVCDSEKLDAVRNRFELNKHDFHITLGFKYKDVFGVRKNEIFKKEEKFIKVIRDEFYKNKDFKFIKDIKNYDLDPKTDIIPVKLSDTMLKVKCEGYYLDIGYSNDGETLWIYTKYSIEDELPRLSETEILKIIKK